MWLIYTFLYCCTIALVHYLDEYLTASNTAHKSAGMHHRIGGLLIISTLLSVVTVAALGWWLESFEIGARALALALGTAVTMVAVWAAYFYLFVLYPAHQVVPLFGLSSVWLLGLEILFGAQIGGAALLGITLLVLGAYWLDAGGWRWRIPTKLLALMAPVSLCWAASLFMFRLAAQTADVATIFFYQYVGIGVIGLLLISLVAPYRRGFLHRLRAERGHFLGISVLNETLSQVSFFFVMLAIAAAPLASYVTALGGLQGLLVLVLFWMLPMNIHRHRVLRHQWWAILMMAAGILLIEVWK